MGRDGQVAKNILDGWLELAAKLRESDSKEVGKGILKGTTWKVSNATEGSGKILKGEYKDLEEFSS